MKIADVGDAGDAKMTVADVCSYAVVVLSVSSTYDPGGWSAKLG